MTLHRTQLKRTGIKINDRKIIIAKKDGFYVNGKRINPLHKQRKTSVASAKRKAWKAFSLYIRMKDSVDGVNECYTCGKVFPIKKLQAGHWIEGHANAVYINEDYVRVQCYSCNVIKHGNQGVFRDKIREELGSDIVDQLIVEAHQIKDLTLSDYLELARFYTEQTEKL